MARRCGITGKSVMAGNNVSHAKNRTRRKFLPNMQNVSLQSASLEKFINLRICTSAIRTIEHHGGLDSFLMSKSSNSKISLKILKLQKKIKKKLFKASSS